MRLVGTRWAGIAFTALILSGIFRPDGAHAAEFQLHEFQRVALNDVYYSEGANVGDLNSDGHPDIVSGPYWYQGPDFQQKHEIYPPKPQPTTFYADNFFSWVYDFDHDGWADVFVVGFPGTPAHVYQNPGKPTGKSTAHWKKHIVFDAVSNESPHFVNVVGDEQPELVCTFNGAFGFATIDPERPFEKWKFHAVSDKSAPERFGHGLGVGDLDGDGRADILAAAGWWQQPAENATRDFWTFHANAFTSAYGGAEMYVYDVDGDGDNDVITSLAAHDFGLAWYEQDRSGREIVFRQRMIMNKTPAENRYGVVFTELHSLALADMDSDGLKDIVTGKTYWSHHKSSPLWDAGAVVYWFKLERTPEGVNWIPYLADGEAGIGRQVIVADLNKDSYPDIVVGGMKGAHALVHGVKSVPQAEWEAAQPKPQGPLNRGFVRGQPPELDPVSQAAAGVFEAEGLSNITTKQGFTRFQEMAGFPRDRWSAGKQLFWNGGKAGDKLEATFELPKGGKFDVSGVLTMAPDYAIIQLYLNGNKVGSPIDLFNSPDVITTGEITIGEVELPAGATKLEIELVGANPAAVPSLMMGIDYLRLQPAAAK